MAIMSPDELYKKAVSARESLKELTDSITRIRQDNKSNKSLDQNVINKQTILNEMFSEVENKLIKIAKDVDICLFLMYYGPK